MSAPQSLLEVEDLSVRFETDDGTSQAVDRFSLSLAPREVLGIVGESGCGKSVTMMSLLRLLPPTAVVTGTALFDGEDLLETSAARLRSTIPKRRNNWSFINHNYLFVAIRIS